MEYHKPVLYREVLEGLNIKQNGIYIDCTLGGGGHAEMILQYDDSVKLIGIDQDINAINFAKERLKTFGDRVKIFQNNFKNIEEIMYLSGYEKVDGILMDIGVSSRQLDDPERGFSYRYDAKLDMRMDQSIKESAYDIVNNYSEKDLQDIIYKYGEEPNAKRIVSNILYYRENVKKIETTFELVDIIKKSMKKRMKKHPAKRTFQALRIYVNKELEVLEEAITKSVNYLNDGGRLSVITFHSLEDKMVKNLFRTFKNPCTCPPEIPVCVCEKKSLGEIITRKPIVAKEDELEMNKRAHSAKLRIFERRYT